MLRGALDLLDFTDDTHLLGATVRQVSEEDTLTIWVSSAYSRVSVMERTHWCALPSVAPCSLALCIIFIPPSQRILRVDNKIPAVGVFDPDVIVGGLDFLRDVRHTRLMRIWALVLPVLGVHRCPKTKHVKSGSLGEGSR